MHCVQTLFHVYVMRLLLQGLQETILGNQPSFSVISNGAECVLIDKKYYIEHAPDALLKRLTFEVRYVTICEKVDS
jgi:hypothetical protein